MLIGKVDIITLLCNIMLSQINVNILKNLESMLIGKVDIITLLCNIMLSQINVNILTKHKWLYSIIIPPDTQYIGAIQELHLSVGLSVGWSVGPLVWTFLVNTISQQPLVRIQYNFTRMIDTKPSCAYCRHVALDYFFNELWPLEFLIHSWPIDISCEHYFSATLGQNSI